MSICELKKNGEFEDLIFNMPYFAEDDVLKEWLSVQYEKIKNGITEYLFTQFSISNDAEYTEVKKNYFDEILKDIDYELYKFDVKISKQSLYFTKILLPCDDKLDSDCFEIVFRSKYDQRETIDCSMSFSNIIDRDIIVHLIICKLILSNKKSWLLGILESRGVYKFKPDEPTDISRYNELCPNDIYLQLIYTWYSSDTKYNNDVNKSGNKDKLIQLIHNAHLTNVVKTKKHRIEY